MKTYKIIFGSAMITALILIILSLIFDQREILFGSLYSFIVNLILFAILYCLEDLLKNQYGENK